ADQIVERARKDSAAFPQKTLEEFLRNRKHDSQARRLAYEWLRDGDKTIPERFLPDMLDDPSPDLRYDAVDRVLTEAEKLSQKDKQAERLQLYQKAFAAARDKKQIDKAVRRLREMGQKIDLATHLGLVLDWRL